MGSQCYIVEDPLYIEVPSSIVLKRHSDNHLALENPRGMSRLKDVSAIHFLDKYCLRNHFCLRILK